MAHPLDMQKFGLGLNWRGLFLNGHGCPMGWELGKQITMKDRGLESAKTEMEGRSISRCCFSMSCLLEIR